MAFLVFGPAEARTSVASRLERMVGESNVIVVADPPGPPPGQVILLLPNQELQSQFDRALSGGPVLESCRLQLSRDVDIEDVEPTLRQLLETGNDIEFEVTD
jgi:hypothetical protein